MTVFDPISAINIPTRNACNSTNYLPPESSVSKPMGWWQKLAVLAPRQRPQRTLNSLIASPSLLATAFVLVTR